MITLLITLPWVLLPTAIYAAVFRSDGRRRSWVSALEPSPPPVVQTAAGPDRTASQACPTCGRVEVRES